MDQLNDDRLIETLKSPEIAMLLAIMVSRGNSEDLERMFRASMNRLDSYVNQVLQFIIKPEVAPVLGLIASAMGPAEAVADMLVSFSGLMFQFPKGDHARNVEIAIAACEVAARVFTRETWPEYWATVQNNLGSMHIQRVLGERAENLSRAINCLKNALEVYTREAFPQKWTNLQINLGTAYRESIRGNKKENLNKAISCTSEALQVINREASPEAWIKGNANLGSAYNYLYRIDKERDNWEAAIHHLSAALEVCTPKTETWADIQNNLGFAYFDRIQEKAEYSEEKAEYSEAAIARFDEALTVFTREEFPQKWAKVKHNLGIAYRERIREEKAENLSTAISCFNEAWQVCDREAFPQDGATLKFNLGLAYQQAGQWDNAYKAFAEAINIVESSRGEIVVGSAIEGDKQKLAEEWNELYQRMVEVCLVLDKGTEAIEYVERSKTRNLVELILERDLDSIFPEDVARQLAELRDEIARVQFKLQNAKDDRPFALKQRLQQLRQQRNELQDKQMRIGPSFNFDEFRAKLDGRTAIVEFYIIYNKLLTFIFTRQTPQPIVLQSEREDIDKLVDWIDGYLRAYNNEKDEKKYWKSSLLERLDLLAKILHIDEIIQQIPEECDRLILVPHRFLHLFPLHALPVTEDSYPIDQFKKGVGYAPSCQLLQLAQIRQRPDFTHLFAVENPTEDLTYAALEVEAIKGYFHQPADILKKADATQAAITGKNLKDVHCFHFSGHGYFNFDNPRKSALLPAEAYLDPPPAPLDPERHLPLPDGGVLNLEKCLTLDAILTLNLEKCRLVTLSACETGLIDFQNTSDEYIGITNVFLVAGTPAVIISLWEVNAVSTAFLMIEFYHNLHASLTVAEALNKAQLWLRDVTKVELEQWIEDKQLPLDEDSDEQVELDQLLYKLSPTDKPFQLPYYWAGFCAVGL